MFIDESGKPILQDVLDCLLQQQLEDQWEKDAEVTKESLLPLDVVLSIIEQASAILRKEENVVHVDAPVNVVGDIHGQFLDLLYLFELCGPLTQNGFTPTEGVTPVSSGESSGGADDDIGSRGGIQALADGCASASTAVTSDDEGLAIIPINVTSSYQKRRPKILRKRSEEHLSFTYKRRNSIWVASDLVKKSLTGNKEDASRDGDGADSSITLPSSGLLTIGGVPMQEREILSSAAFQSPFDVVPEELPVYLFMGDYVDRGIFGCECMLYLLALKVVFPDNIVLLRGNHETRCMTKRHFDDGTNFEAECVAKYGQQAYEAFMLCFDCLPLTAVVETGDKPFLAVHGGISKKIKTLEDINAIDRFCEPPLKGAMCDLLWSDPVNEKVAERFNDSDYQEFLEFDYLPNPVRGCSSYYCYGAVHEFLTSNNFAGIFRAHECKEDGISFTFAKTRTECFAFPLVTTVFSAPNYCGTYDNRGAVVRITGSDIDILRFGPASANPLQPTADVPTEAKEVSVSRFSGKLNITESNSEKFQQAVQQDLCSELHPGWQSLRKVTRIVTLLSKYRRATSMSGTALLTNAASPGGKAAAAQRKGMVRRTATFSDSHIEPSYAEQHSSVSALARASVKRAQRRATVGEDPTGLPQHVSHRQRASLSQREAGLALFGRRFVSVQSPSSVSEQPEDVDVDDRAAAAACMMKRKSLSDSVSEEDNDQLRILFNAIDQDGNGSISPRELEQFGLELGCESHVIARVRDLMDQNHDGVISFDEFVEYAGELLYTVDPPHA